MSRRRKDTIRITIHYEGSTIKIYAYDEHTGRSVGEVLQREDPRCKDLEKVKSDLCDQIKGVSSYEKPVQKGRRPKELLQQPRPKI